MKLSYQFSNNKNIQQYIEDMATWIVNNSSCSIQEVEDLFISHKDKIENIFSPHPETAFHYDPSKFAEMLAIHWSLISEPEFEFV